MSARNRELAALLPVALLVTAGFTAVFLVQSNQIDGLSLTYGGFFLAGGPAPIGLEQIVVGNHPGRSDPGQITLYCSVGLAGTEVVLAGEILRRAAAK